MLPRHGIIYNVAGAAFYIYGPVAQLGERSVRIREVDGSIPFRSTMYEEVCKKIPSFFCSHAVRTSAASSAFTLSLDFTPQ